MATEIHMQDAVLMIGELYIRMRVLELENERMKQVLNAKPPTEKPPNLDATANLVM